MGNAVFVNGPTFAAGGHAISRSVQLLAPVGRAACKQPVLLLASDTHRALAALPLAANQAGQGLTTCEPLSEAPYQSVAFDLLSPVENSDLANAPIHQSHERR
jgi:hypothetical protein